MDKEMMKRLNEMETLTKSIKSEMNVTLQEAYRRACENNDKDAAEDFLRRLRNKELDESDKEMSLDRLGIRISSVSDLLKSLKTVFDSDWANYRQALRDLPQQEGFPFNVKFPEPPKRGDK